MAKVRTADGSLDLDTDPSSMMRSRLGLREVKEMEGSTMRIDRGEFVPYVGDEQPNVSPTAAAQHFPELSSDLSHKQHRSKVSVSMRRSDLCVLIVSECWL